MKTFSQFRVECEPAVMVDDLTARTKKHSLK